jgi:hypothetical protein
MAQAKYDAEQFLNDVEAILKAHLPAKLAEISAEKADDMPIPAPKDESYMLQTLNDKVNNFTPFLVYGLAPGMDQGIGPSTAEEWVVSVVIGITDTGQHAKKYPAAKKLLRYRRALKEVFEDHWLKLRNGLKISVKGLTPVALQLQNSSEEHRVVGILISATAF